MSEWLVKLYAKAESIDYTTIGDMAVTIPAFIEKQEGRHWLKRLIRVTVAQALLDNIGIIPDNLRVRNLQPEDFVLVNGNGSGNYQFHQIRRGAWEQPPRVFLDHKKKKYGNLKALPGGWDIEDILIYMYDRSCHNERKVTSIYGIEDMSLEHEAPCVKQVQFWRGNKVRLIEILDTVKCMPAKIAEPILLKRSDELSIWFRMKDYAEGESDNIAFHGIVCESIGE